MTINKETYKQRIWALIKEGTLDRFREFALASGDGSEGKVALKRTYHTLILPRIKEILGAIDPVLEDMDYLQSKIMEYVVGDVEILDVQRALIAYVEALSGLAEEYHVDTLTEALEMYKKRKIN